MILKLGSTGDEVRALQAALKAAGFDPNGVDGIFGLDTHLSVIAFQTAHKLTVDGEVDWPRGETATALGVAATPAPTMASPADASYAACLAFTLQQEGGFVDNPADPGGATNHGITIATLEAYQHGATIEMLKSISPDLVSAIYRRDYWTVMGAGNLPDGVNLMVFDFGVNAGPARSVGFLQIVAGVKRDGLDGALTQAAIAKMSPIDVIAKLSGLQRAYYQALPGFNTFGDGWIARTERRVTLALKMAAPKGQTA